MVSISLVTCVFKASVFLDELLHSAVCQLGGFTCVFLFALLSSLSLSVHFLYGLFSIYSNLFGDLYFGYDPSLNKTLSLSLFKIQVTYNLYL